MKLKTLLHNLHHFAAGLMQDEDPGQDPLAHVAKEAAKGVKRAAQDEEIVKELRTRLRRCEKLLLAAQGSIRDQMAVTDEEEQNQPMLKSHIRIADRVDAYFRKE